MSLLETPALRHRLNDDALDAIFRAARTHAMERFEQSMGSGSPSIPHLPN